MDINDEKGRILVLLRPCVREVGITAPIRFIECQIRKSPIRVTDDGSEPKDFPTMFVPGTIAELARLNASSVTAKGAIRFDQDIE